VITAAYAVPPLRLAELAPLVTAAAEQGDPAARAVVEQAAACLVGTARKVRGPGPTVLAGACLAGDNPVGKSVAARLREDGGDVRFAAAAEVGAAWLAAVRASGSHGAASRDLHRVMLGGAVRLGAPG
jgi:N-acetylglucosamine kinase-like BadF-type ATPase